MGIFNRTRRGSCGIGAMALAVFYLLCASPNQLQASIAVDTNDLLTFEYQQVGANEEEAVRLASIRAVNATIGQLLLSDYSLQARDLLDPYIQKNYQQFVASYYILERRAGRDGFGVRIRVQTFSEKLNRDLREKRFLYRPKLSPYHYVFLEETLDGQPSPSDTVRQAVIQAIRSLDGKVYATGVTSPSNNTDVMTSPAAFAAAREAALRIGAGIIISGRADTGKAREKDILYNKITTYQTTLTLAFVRADDGTLMTSADKSFEANDPDSDKARAQSIQRAAETICQKLLTVSRDMWKRTTPGHADFEIMLTNVKPAQAEAISRHIESQLAEGTRLRLRSYYGEVAVLNVVSPRAYSALERAIREFSELQLRISDHKGNRITINVNP